MYIEKKPRQISNKLVEWFKGKGKELWLSVVFQFLFIFKINVYIAVRSSKKQFF